MTCFTVKKSVLHGEITAPPSKSHSLRAILLASLVKGQSRVDNFLVSPDVEAMIEACKQIGAKITLDEEKDCPSIIIEGIDGQVEMPKDLVYCANSGQVLRFMAAVLALAKEGQTLLAGDNSLRHNRPMQTLIDALNKLGAFCISTKGDGFAPIVVGTGLKSGKVIVDGADSQPVSALLMATAFVPGITKIFVRNAGEKPWVDLTLSWLKKIGVKVEHENHAFYRVYGGNQYQGFTYKVAGDFSSLLFPVVGAILTDSEIMIQNVDYSDVQGDKKALDLLCAMGADISYLEKEQALKVRGGRVLQGMEIDVNDIIDSLPVLAVVGCFAEGTTKLFNAKVARTKECDRIFSITKELKRMGADIEELADGLIVKKSALKGTTVYSYNDHRMIMALCVAGMMAEGVTFVEDVDLVVKSYPNFYEDMRNLGVEMEIL